MKPTQEQVIAWAREAGLVMYDYEHPSLERFANLVAAAEREKVAKWMMARAYATGHGESVEELLQELEWQIRETEREACAKVCEELGYYVKHGGWTCADEIRERGAPALERLNKAAEDNGEEL